MRVCYDLFYGIGPQDVARKYYIKKISGEGGKFQKFEFLAFPHRFLCILSRKILRGVFYAFNTYVLGCQKVFQKCDKCTYLLCFKGDDKN